MFNEEMKVLTEHKVLLWGEKTRFLFFKKILDIKHILKVFDFYSN